MDKKCLNQYLFLDDWAFLCSGISQIKRIMKNLEKLSNARGMIINLKKCGILFLGGKNRKKYSLLVNIDTVNEYKFLGILLNYKL